MSTKKDDKKASAEGEEVPRKSKKILILILVAVVVLAAGGGAAWFFLVKNKSHAEENKKKPSESTAPALFVPLDRFTVNLVQEQGDQVMQLGVTLKTYDPELEEKIKKEMPEIRSRLLELLSSKRASELQTLQGKKRLAAEILYLTNKILGFKKTPPPDLAPSAAPVAQAPVTPPALGNSGGLAAALQQADAKAVVTAPPKPVSVRDFLPEPDEDGGSRDGVVDVLFTDFIIQ
ncbi:flagellar basal body-associated protein FliL [Ferrovum sp.]|jgi:flagellar FliL protein|uniref:flagellar basal body-associated protein FliL n=1 Tax=Ferrovum sp. TaxID=2609467 RepID=UPI00261C7C22|nr:flagellar basal body-associated protein FliL [Ferrovum sp.]